MFLSVLKLSEVSTLKKCCLEACSTHTSISKPESTYFLMETIFFFLRLIPMVWILSRVVYISRLYFVNEYYFIPLNPYLNSFKYTAIISPLTLCLVKDSERRVNFLNYIIMWEASGTEHKRSHSFVNVFQGVFIHYVAQWPELYWIMYIWLAQEPQISSLYLLLTLR